MINSRDIGSLISSGLKIGIIGYLVMGSYGCVTKGQDNYNIAPRHWQHDGMWKGHPKGHFVYDSTPERKASRGN